MSNQPTKWYRLEPTDAWFFRDGTPSNQGEDQSDLESLFPPHPSTVIGALRAALAREQGWSGKGRWEPNLNQVLGDGFNNLGQLKFSGPLLELDECLLFRIPLHVLGKVDENKKSFQPLDWLVPSENPVSCDLGEVRLPEPLGMFKPEHGEKSPSSDDEFFVTTEGMKDILDGKLPSADQCIHRDNLFVLEPRVGIERNIETRTTGEGAIYSPQYIRLKPGVRLVVGISGLPRDWDLPHFFPLGGESRLAGCDKIDPPTFPVQASGIEGRLVVLVTPGCFTKGDWWGGGPDNASKKLTPAISGTVTSATFDRPVGIGGWDTLNRCPLPMRPCIRPGAVWWIDTDTATEIAEREYLLIGDQTASGFGMAFIGKQATKET